MTVSEVATLNPTHSGTLSENRLQASAPLAQAFNVTFWGVRGSVPTPSSETAIYGGNTACIELNLGDKRLILDGGTGIRMLGKHLAQESGVNASIFFTHTQWDRIQGFPFFVPAFIAGNSFDIYGTPGTNGASIKQRLGEQMLRPNFPAPLQEMRAALNFHDIMPGAVLNLDGILVETMSLSHLNSALGYRITWNDITVVYAIDSAYASDKMDEIDASLLYLAQDADLLIFDMFYPEHAYYQADGSGSRPLTWQMGINVAIAAQAKRVVMFHHDPADDDEVLARTEAEAQSRFANIQFAREGGSIQLKSAGN
jgi:phosphoribosyl 1,2-cyclic phosphodiesterase